MTEKRTEDETQKRNSGIASVQGYSAESTGDISIPQRTYNPNLPLRDLFYVAKVYQGMTKDNNLYGRLIVEIPAPKFIVFYNGVEKQPERQELRLSDSFQKTGNEVCLELKVLMLNINPGYNEDLMESCRTLREYMLYVEKVRKYEKSMELKSAVERAVNESVKEGILAEFLTKYRAEATSVSIFEYDEEKHMQQEREQWEQIGEQKGEKGGAAKKVIALIIKKKAKGYDTSTIADHLEEPEESVKAVCEMIDENPSISVEDIWKQLRPGAEGHLL
ncbi:hypothetical protein [Hespellia stercorisuis]|uniref:PD-(D/E)XK nuclease family transposase n=1 Tax=Hespellia stercorisuis DSM 15480 TaxID=1121950 RepID=A0A1M6KCE5_9FIRM|nr:hypothetical protein [Hespellia stercorisuis]SHJ56590.1 hypothetical protein SAMN02745243_00887 [Hespellia stercorisuis DSM 15480]